MKRYIISITAAAVFCVSLDAWSYFESSSDQRPASMNGIKFDDYKDFPTKWHLVTVRYRLDSNEMRFTYANEQAWKEMQNLKPNYSDGAIFAKVGMVVEKDPGFTSSLVPSGAKRYQFMVRDKKKYAITQGWGYALFDSEGNLFKEDVKAKTLACAACHNLVPERDYVFSRPMNLAYGSKLMNIESSNQFSKNLQFKQADVKKFPATLKKILPNENSPVLSLEGEIQRNAFSGTLDEIVPFLIENTKMTGKTSTLYVNEKNYTVVVPSSSREKCEEKKLSMLIHVRYNGSTVRNADVCQ